MPEGTVFRVHWSHPAGPGYEADEGVVEVAAGGDPVVVDKVPAGARITLTEAAPDPITGGDWLDPVFSQDTFTVIKDQTVAIDLDNPILLQTGKFQVTKKFDGDGADLVPSDMTFELEYSYPAGVGFEAGEGTITVGADGVAVPSGDLPHGAEVTLTEPAPGDVLGGTWQGFSFSPQTFTIEGNTLVEVTLTNTITRDVGSVEISKTVTGQAAGLVGDDATFTFDWSYDEGPLGGQDGETPIYKADSGTIPVPGDGTAITLDGIPAGAKVSFTEVAPDPVTGGTWQPVTWVGDEGPQVTVVKDESVSVAAVNQITLNTGSFSLAKSLSGTGAELVDPDAEYVVHYSYGPGIGFEAGNGSVTLKADGTPVTVEDLPYGAEILFEEELPAAVEGTTWQAPEFSADGVTIDDQTITIGDQTDVEVELTNTAELNTGGFTLSKALTGTGADLVDPDAEFVVEYSYEAGIGFEAGSGSVTLKADGTPVTVDDLPYGAHVVFTEVTPASVDGASWDGYQFSEEAVTVGDGTVVELVLTNTITADTPPAPDDDPSEDPGDDPSDEPAPDEDKDLADTGAPGVAPIAVAAIVLVVAGATLVVAARRRTVRVDKQ